MEDGILIAPAPYSALAAYFNPAAARMSGVEVLMGSSQVRYGQTDLDADETYLGLNDSDFDQDPNRRYSSTRFDNIEARQQRYALRHLIAINDQVDLATTLYYNQFSRNWFKLHNIRNAAGQSIGLS